MLMDTNFFYNSYAKINRHELCNYFFHTVNFQLKRIRIHRIEYSCTKNFENLKLSTNEQFKKIRSIDFPEFMANVVIAY